MLDCKVVRLESRGLGQLETGLNLETTLIFYLNVVNYIRKLEKSFHVILKHLLMTE